MGKIPNKPGRYLIVVGPSRYAVRQGQVEPGSEGPLSHAVSAYREGGGQEPLAEIPIQLPGEGITTIREAKLWSRGVATT